ncbi:unnamed protein product [Parajaminaea phylloscopi]
MPASKTAANVVLEPLQSGTTEVTQSAQILSEVFTASSGRVYPKGRTTAEILAWRVESLERLLEMQKRGLRQQTMIAKRAGSDDVAGVATWIIRDPVLDAAAKDRIDVPLPALPADVDLELRTGWKTAFEDVTERYGRRRADKWAELIYLAVDPTLQRSGVGSALLKAAMADVLPHVEVFFLVTAPTPSAVPFYERHGFEDVETVDSVPGLPGPWQCHVMQYRNGKVAQETIPSQGE